VVDKIKEIEVYILNEFEKSKLNNLKNKSGNEDKENKSEKEGNKTKGVVVSTRLDKRSEQHPPNIFNMRSFKEESKVDKVDKNSSNSLKCK